MWQGVRDVLGVPSWDVVKPLLYKTLLQRFMESGLRLAEDETYLYFPNGLAAGDKIWYRNHVNRKVPLTLVGDRTYRRHESFRYHAAWCAADDVYPGSDHDASRLVSIASRCVIAPRGAPARH